MVGEKSKSFDPDQDDEGSLCEDARDEGIQHYEALEDLGNQARLALIAGMFHLWDRSLRKWLSSYDGASNFSRGGNLRKSIWGSNFAEILEIFEGIGRFQPGCSIRDTLDTCRLVVNTYKHGSGPSEKQLKDKRPELFDQYEECFTNYPYLYVQDTHIDEFSAAIEDFWRKIPKRITDKEFLPGPKWFQKAYEKDCMGVKK